MFVSLSTAKTGYISLMESLIRNCLCDMGITSEERLLIPRILIFQQKANWALAELNFIDSCHKMFRILRIKLVGAVYCQ